MKLTENSFVLLVEAMMAQAYTDLSSKDDYIRSDAQLFINRMKEAYGNM